jgi:hypothetical protein
MVNFPGGKNQANHFLQESGLSQFRIEEFQDLFQLQVYYAGQWWGGEVLSNPMDLVQIAQTFGSFAERVLEQVPLELENLTSQLGLMTDAVQVYHQETHQRLVNNAWLRGELGSVAETLAQAIALLIQIRDVILDSNLFPVFYTDPSRRSNSALTRAERIFQAIWLWNWQHPDDCWAVNLGLLDATFGITRSAAQEFLNTNRERIKSYHDHIGVRNSRSHNRRKATAETFCQFVFQSVDNSAFLYLEDIEQRCIYLDQVVLNLLSSLRGSRNQTIEEVAGRLQETSQDLLEEICQRPLNFWQVNELLQVLRLEYDAKRQGIPQHGAPPRFSLETIHRVRLRPRTMGSLVNAIVIETSAGDRVVTLLAHLEDDGGLSLREVEVLRQWLSNQINS